MIPDAYDVCQDVFLIYVYYFDTPHAFRRGILGSLTVARKRVLHSLPERIGSGVSRPTVCFCYAKRRSPSFRIFFAALVSRL